MAYYYNPNCNPCCVDEDADCPCLEDTLGYDVSVAGIVDGFFPNCCHELDGFFEMRVQPVGSPTISGPLAVLDSGCSWRDFQDRGISGCLQSGNPTLIEMILRYTDWGADYATLPHNPAERHEWNLSGLVNWGSGVHTQANYRLFRADAGCPDVLDLPRNGNTRNCGWPTSLTIVRAPL